MIFKPEMVEKILAAEKTVTRRPVKWEDTGFEVRNLPCRYEVDLPCRYEVGKDYAVQPGRGQKAVARIRIKDVRRGLLGGVDDAEARLEGFSSAGLFRVYWEQLYGSYDATRLVDRIEFELVPDAAPTPERDA